MNTHIEASRHLIVGTGVAGLMYAIKVAQLEPGARITILTKSEADESNTRYAQGGIAAVADENDSPEVHFGDTIRTGDGLCAMDVVQTVVSEGPERLMELAEIGARFDLTEDERFDLALEGGHSRPRVVHHKDSTGKEIIRVLLEKIREFPHVHIHSGQLATELILDHGDGLSTRCVGVEALDTRTGKIKCYYAENTLLAGGGAGQLYARTTNPAIATGDAVAMAHRAGATVENLEFVQFHPTVFFDGKGHPPFLISEAVRGFGATLRTLAGEPLMKGRHPLRDLAPRDVVSRVISEEMTRTRATHVLLDCTALETHAFHATFPEITRRLLRAGLDPTIQPIPVAPAAHYLVGGITTDLHGRTDIPHLYAAGECAHTGLHGGNRLASNSLTEALVFAHRAALHASKTRNDIRYLGENPNAKKPSPCAENPNPTVVPEIKSQIQHLVSNHLGIVRTQNGLEFAKRELGILGKRLKNATAGTHPDALSVETKNLWLLAGLMVDASLERKDNCGVFYKTENAVGTPPREVALATSPPILAERP